MKLKTKEYEMFFSHDFFVIYYRSFIYLFEGKIYIKNEESSKKFIVCQKTADIHTKKQERTTNKQTRSLKSRKRL